MRTCLLTVNSHGRLDIACDGYGAIPASISGIAGKVTMVHPSRYRCLSWVIPSPTSVQVRDTPRLSETMKLNGVTSWYHIGSSLVRYLTSLHPPMQPTHHAFCPVYGSNARGPRETAPLETLGSNDSYGRVWFCIRMNLTRERCERYTSRARFIKNSETVGWFWLIDLVAILVACSTLTFYDHETDGDVKNSRLTQGIWAASMYIRERGLVSFFPPRPLLC